MAALINIQQPVGKRIASTLDGPVSREPIEISLHAQDRERPGARTGKLLRVAGAAASKSLPAAPRRPASPERPSTVPSAQKARPWLSSDPIFFHPAAVVAEEVSEPAAYCDRRPARGMPGSGE